MNYRKTHLPKFEWNCKHLPWERVALSDVKHILGESLLENEVSRFVQTVTFATVNGNLNINFNFRDSYNEVKTAFEQITYDLLENDPDSAVHVSFCRNSPLVQMPRDVVY